MLAEISNELQNGEQLGYVTEVLDRVGMSNVAYLGDQSSFRDAIMSLPFVAVADKRAAKIVSILSVDVLDVS